MNDYHNQMNDYGTRLSLHAQSIHHQFVPKPKFGLGQHGMKPKTFYSKYTWSHDKFPHDEPRIVFNEQLRNKYIRHNVVDFNNSHHIDSDDRDILKDWCDTIMKELDNILLSMKFLLKGFKIIMISNDFLQQI